MSSCRSGHARAGAPRRRSGPGAAGRAGVLARVLAAAVGGYACTVALAVFVSRVLPGSRADAVVSAMLGSFAVFVVAVLWAFAARSAGRAWLGLALPAAVLGALAWLLARPVGA